MVFLLSSRRRWYVPFTAHTSVLVGGTAPHVAGTGGMRCVSLVSMLMGVAMGLAYGTNVGL